MEYNTTGEVDGENNTDLEKPNPSIATKTTRWYDLKKKGPIQSKYVAMMKKNMKDKKWAIKQIGATSTHIITTNQMDKKG